MRNGGTAGLELAGWPALGRGLAVLRVSHTFHIRSVTWVVCRLTIACRRPVGALPPGCFVSAGAFPVARSGDWCSGDGAGIDAVAGYAIRPFAVTQEFAPAAKLASTRCSFPCLSPCLVCLPSVPARARWRNPAAAFLTRHVGVAESSKPVYRKTRMYLARPGTRAPSWLLPDERGRSAEDGADKAGGPTGVGRPESGCRTRHVAFPGWRRIPVEGEGAEGRDIGVLTPGRERVASPVSSSAWCVRRLHPTAHPM